MLSRGACRDRGRGGAVQGAVAPGKNIEIVGIAAAHHTGQRHAALQAAFYDVIVARAKPGIAERQLAQLVVAVRIDAGIVKNDVGLVGIDGATGETRYEVRPNAAKEDGEGAS